MRLSNWVAIALISTALAVPVSAQTPPAIPSGYAILPPEAPADAPVLSEGLVWVSQPEAVDYFRYYPQRAQQDRVSGEATLDCLVNDDGRLSCRVISETPEGYDFGLASLRVARSLRVAPQTRDGTPTAGGRINHTIRWRIS